MIAALLLGAAVTPPPPPVTEDEIVVVARKMRYIRVDMKAPRRHGRLVLEQCRVSRPSGYRELDIIPCDVAQQCMQSGPETRQQLTDCVEARSQQRLDAVVQAWRAAARRP